MKNVILSMKTQKLLALILALALTMASLAACTGGGSAELLQH